MRTSSTSSHSPSSKLLCAASMEISRNLKLAPERNLEPGEVDPEDPF